MRSVDASHIDNFNHLSIKSHVFANMNEKQQKATMDNFNQLTDLKDVKIDKSEVTKPRTYNVKHQSFYVEKQT